MQVIYTEHVIYMFYVGYIHGTCNIVHVLCRLYTRKMLYTGYITEHVICRLYTRNMTASRFVTLCEPLLHLAFEHSEAIF